MALSTEATRAPCRNWDLRPTPKFARCGVVRTIPPTETIRRVTPLMKIIGVTRAAEVTGLDRVGIHNFTTVRPRERGEGISYYNGKGLTRAAAHAGALMEAIERYSGELCDHPIHYCTRDEIERHGPTIDPASIIVPRTMEYFSELRLEWVEGFDLLSGNPSYLPLNAVIFPYEPPAGRPVLYDSGTNGLASGNTLEEALCHALCEVIERDASAVSDAWTDLAPAVSRALQRMGLAAADGNPEETRFPLIDLESLPRRGKVLVRRLQRAGIVVYLRDITSTAGIATFDCVIVDRGLGGPPLAAGGTGTHPDARVAVTRALTEAAQSRVGYIQGGREDLVRIVRASPAVDPDRLYGRETVRPFSSVASTENANIDDDIRLLLNRLRDEGFREVIAVNLTRPEVGVPVVRVVIPGMEAWSTYVTHGRRGRFGSRVAAILHRRRANTVHDTILTRTGT
jgi:ribosomal protein S12 methylthiotransferase accessory factor